MNLEELNQSLELQVTNLKMLLNTAVTKQKALIKNDLKALETEMHSEEKLLLTISNQTVKVSTIIGKLSSEYGMADANPTLSEFIKSVSEEKDTNIKVIVMLRNTIHELVQQIDYTNKQNNILIEHARSFIRDLISSIIGISKKSLLDAKA